MARGRCHRCGEVASVKAPGGVRACLRHASETERPWWVHVPADSPVAETAAMLQEAGALSPELAELLDRIDHVGELATPAEIDAELERITHLGDS